MYLKRGIKGTWYSLFLAGLTYAIIEIKNSKIGETNEKAN